MEGTAIEALAGMHTVLQNRPKQFQSLEQAVEWCVRSGQVAKQSCNERTNDPEKIVFFGYMTQCVIKCLTDCNQVSN